MSFLGVCGLSNYIMRVIGWFTSWGQNRKRRDKTKKSGELNKHVQKQETPNTLTCVIYGKEYTARFNEGKVYSVFNEKNECLIGYYLLENGQWKVRCASDKGEVGTIEPSGFSTYIYLKRTGDLKRYKESLNIEDVGSVVIRQELKRQYMNALKNTELIFLCAEASMNVIYDVDTRELVATSTSNDAIGNSAAFICLNYQVIQKGKYNSFYSPII